MIVKVFLLLLIITAIAEDDISSLYKTNGPQYNLVPRAHVTLLLENDLHFPVPQNKDNVVFGDEIGLNNTL